MSEQQQTVSGPSNMLTRFLDEIGLRTFYNSSLDTKLLCFQRFVRLFAYGGCTLILASFLEVLGNQRGRIGLFMTLTLIGDTIISLFLTLYADRLGRRAILGAGALLMTFSGIVFALSGNYFVLLAAAVFGVIAPSGNEIGPFRAIEESTLAHLNTPEKRSDIFAWYSLIGFSGAATGMMASGWMISSLQAHGWTMLEAYKFTFYAYAAMGFLKFLLTLSMSQLVEVEAKQKSARNDETAPLLAQETEPPASKQKWNWRSLLPQVSRESVSILIKLCLLFAIDSFASGLAPLAWQTFFFKTKFNLSEGILGSIFFTTTLVASLSMLVSSSIAKRIGNIKAMVFTHLPSAIALALIAIPDQLPIALTLLILRSCTQSMDTVPRSAFLAAVVLPSERTAIMGTVNVVKTCAQSLSPFLTGILAEKNLFWLAFVLAGTLKAIYDISILIVFLGQKPREEEVTASSGSSEGGASSAIEQNGTVSKPLPASTA